MLLTFSMDIPVDRFVYNPISSNLGTDFLHLCLLKLSPSFWNYAHIWHSKSIFSKQNWNTIKQQNIMETVFMVHFWQYDLVNAWWGFESTDALGCCALTSSAKKFFFSVSNINSFRSTYLHAAVKGKIKKHNGGM